MHLQRIILSLCAGIGCAAITLPPVAFGETPAINKGPQTSISTRAAFIGDVELDSGGCLRGMVVNIQGVPVADTEVVLKGKGFEPITAKTDPLGRFRIGYFRGGTYQVEVGQQTRVIRAWASRTGPPKSKDYVLVVTGNHVVRGQMQAGDFFGSNAVVVSGLVAAMIAIPVSVQNSGKDQPSSP